MKMLLIIACYIIGVIISTIIFLKIFKYEAPKDEYGRPIYDHKRERDYYTYISIISWLYPVSIYVIMLYYIIIALINFIIIISKYINKLCG